MTHKLILQDADRCVKCGLCLPLCPTYRESGDEGESPRGRIALIQGLAEGQLVNSSRLGGHLDRCLGCRACEAGCPSGVAYGRLIAASAALRRRERGPLPRLLGRTGLDLMVKQRPLRLAARVLRLYQRSGLQTLSRRTGLLKLLGLARLDQLLPRLPAPFQPPAASSRLESSPRTVKLFSGCMAQVMESPVLNAAITILERTGHEVRVPSRQCCCGALHQHAGLPGRARRMAERNSMAFADPANTPTLGIDSGCTAHLGEYPTLFATGDDAAPVRCGARVADISHYLSALTWPADIPLAPLHARVAIHDPCTLRNVLKQQDGPYLLLQNIPDIQLLALPGNDSCCGSAGTYLLAQPEISQALLKDKVDAIRSLRPDILVTSNIGCALQLAAGISAAKLGIEVLHPVQLLARQMPSTSNAK